MKRSTPHPHTAWHIVRRYTFTLFNLVNLILAAMILFVGSYRNLFFLGVAAANTLIGIINELRAKHIVDKLKLLSEKHPTIIKRGVPTEVSIDQLRKGDRLILSLGDQIPVDCHLEQGTIEVNEAFITGEQDNIEKRPGDQLVSGSFVVSGAAEATVAHTAKSSFASKLQHEASHIQTADSQLFTLMNTIIKYISYALIPVGALLLWSRFRTESDTAVAVTSTAAALINMIPEGLILLTSGVLALATIRLSRRQVLVQDLYAIETLARIDTICLDKTGTLTTGRMSVVDILTPAGEPINLKSPTTSQQKSILSPLASILTSQTVENDTISALKQTLLKKAKIKATGEIGQITSTILFSSDRKYSGITTTRATYLLGAAEFLLTDPATISQINTLADGHRVLVLVKQSQEHSARELLAIIRLTDELRDSAKHIINYFYQNHIDIKIISGDALPSVTSIAAQAGVRNLTGVDLSATKTKSYTKLARTHSIFARVTPVEKKDLIKALRQQGRTVAMTGDGVNDILAMKEADVSLAIGAGADAARRIAKFVLLDSSYQGLPAIIDEGRRSINNLERSTSLFLAKTVYASILAVLFVFLPLSYPYSPIEMSLLNLLCIGLPGVILALENNTARPKDLFKHNIIHYSIPTGIAVSLAMLALSIVSHLLDFTRVELVTLSFIITFAIDLALIYHVSRPLNIRRLILIISIILLAVLALLVPISRTFFLF